MLAGVVNPLRATLWSGGNINAVVTRAQKKGIKREMNMTSSGVHICSAIEIRSSAARVRVTRQKSEEDSSSSRGAKGVKVLN